MNPLEERLNDRLEHPTIKNGQHPGGFLFSGLAGTQQPDIDELLVLAQHLQQDPQIQVTPDFAQQLERQVLRRQTELRLRKGHWQSSLLAFLNTHRVLGSVLAACLCFCLLSTSMLALAARVTSPSNPLYALKRWEQHVQIQFSNPENQATLHLQLARGDLKALPSLDDANHTQAYEQMLLDLDQQVSDADAAIKNLPAGTSHDHLVNDLASLKAEIRQTLRLLLPGLTFQERLVTTSELARMGDKVPLLASATVALPAHVHELATISLEGKNIAVNAQLLIDGRLTGSLGTLRQGLLTFEIDWNGQQHPQSLGILNPDGTAAQITVITIKQSSTSGKKNGNSNGKGNNNKPTGTPTPKGNKPTGTPTPKGNKPTGTPTPHH